MARGLSKVNQYVALSTLRSTLVQHSRTMPCCSRVAALHRTTIHITPSCTVNLLLYAFSILYGDVCHKFTAFLTLKLCELFWVYKWQSGMFFTHANIAAHWNTLHDCARSKPRHRPCRAIKWKPLLWLLMHYKQVTQNWMSLIIDFYGLLAALNCANRTSFPLLLH